MPLSGWIRDKMSAAPSCLGVLEQRGRRLACGMCMHMTERRVGVELRVASWRVALEILEVRLKSHVKLCPEHSDFAFANGITWNAVSRLLPILQCKVRGELTSP